MVLHLVPNGRRRRVPIVVEHTTGSIEVIRRKLKVLLDCINHGSASCVYTEMLKSLGEVGKIWLAS
jgi:hypothetical protein